MTQPQPSTAVVTRTSLRWRLSSPAERASWKDQPRYEQSSILIDEAQTSQGIFTEVIDQLEQLAGRWLEQHPTHHAVMVDVPVYVKRTNRREVRIKLAVFEEAAPT